jgi:hypothetical protein
LYRTSGRTRAIKHVIFLNIVFLLKKRFDIETINGDFRLHYVIRYACAGHFLPCDSMLPPSFQRPKKACRSGRYKPYYPYLIRN